jgi:hypothetical protein
LTRRSTTTASASKTSGPSSPRISISTIAARTIGFHAPRSSCSERRWRRRAQRGTRCRSGRFLRAST